MLQDHSRNRTPMPAAQPPAGATPPEPGPARAEAGITRMLADAPSSAPAAQTRAALDPVHALITEHRAAYADWDRLSAIPNNMLRSDPGFGAAEAAAAGPGKRESALLDALVAARPTTLAGIAALAEYLPGALRQVDPDEQEPDGEVALRNIAAALHALTVPNAADPILAGIARTRGALDHALAVEAAHLGSGAKTDLPPAWHAASDAAQDAFHRFALKEAPHSQAGCQALARLTLDLREGLGLDLEEETLIVLKRIASTPSGSAGVTLKAVLEDRRARADEFLTLMRKDGFVPYPADKPQGLLAIDLAILYEAERLLTIAQGEFDRLADACSDFPPGERDRHLARLRAEYRLDELAAVVRGSLVKPSASDESTRAILDAIEAHEQAQQAYRRANAAYDAMGDAPGQTPASDEQIAAADEAATEASRLSDQAWRELFKVRPQSLHELWMLLTHIEHHHRDHHGMDDAPDIWGTLTGAVAAIRTATKAPEAPKHDLSKLSVWHLSRLYEITRQQREILLEIEGSSTCEASDGSGYNALGDVIEAEGERFSFLGDDVVHELERRHPSGTEERNYILETRVRHHLTCNGYIERELVAEIAAAWGTK